MTSFANLKRNSGNLDKLAKAIEQLNSAETSNDKDNFWKPEVDKAGNGYAVLRLLPAPAVDGDDGLPWVKVFDHGFQGPGGWYIENSLTTLGQKDPVSEYNSQLWNSGIEANKEVARKQKRRLSYICNVYVVEDPKNPQNEGKVFLYKFGKKIFDKINEAMNPQFEDEKAVNPFDLWEGANFKLKIRNVESYRNYDKSEFAASNALFDDDEKLEEIWKKEYSLKEFLDPSKFKSYDELKGRLDKVLGLDGSAPAPRTTVEQAKASPIARKPVDTGITATSSDDDDMAYFSRLAAD
jgi:hypothetical protein